MLNKKMNEIIGVVIDWKYPCVLIAALVLATSASVGASVGAGQIRTNQSNMNGQTIKPIKKLLIAHRGASSYAPEHTIAAYRLAIDQGADFVEQDLQITRDGVLVCLHDSTLERTTNVEVVFPNRFRRNRPSGQQTEEQARHWYVADFTLAEIRQLDAGSWFDPKFAGARVPTWQEAIDLIRGHAGIYPETKGPEFYDKQGFDMERMVMETLRRNGLDQPGADPRTPVIIQSFSAAGLQKLHSKLKCRLPLIFLIGADKDGELLTAAGLRRIAQFVTGIGPSKGLITANPSIVTNAHQAGLTVTPYTFRSANSSPFPDVRAEMEQFLYTFGVDSLFTDNPDQFPRRD
jgi:glycerophosphoryl diester phosphodiesterase